MKKFKNIAKIHKEMKKEMYDIDGVVGMYSGIYNNPFVFWGKYTKNLFKTTLKISFQFHHTQMDGAHAGKFLELLQTYINELRLENRNEL